MTISSGVSNMINSSIITSRLITKFHFFPVLVWSGVWSVESFTFSNVLVEIFASHELQRSTR